jgi:hypothetical protein
VTATEWWLLAAAIVAGVGALLHLAPATAHQPAGLAPALVAVALVLVAVALAVSPL